MHHTSRIWLGYAALALVASPWYWRWIPAATSSVCGVPAWVAGSVVGSALVSCYTAWLLSYPWSDEMPDEENP